MTRLLAIAASVLPSSLQLLVLRLISDASFGSGVRIGFGSVIWSDRLVLGDGVRVGAFCRIKTRSLRLGAHVVIEGRVRITANEVQLGPRCTIGQHTRIAGNPSRTESRLTAGMYSWIFQECYVDVTRPVVLGRNVGVGGRSLIFTHGFWLSALDGYPVARGPVTIGDDVWLPWECFIMPGVSIGDGAVVGARSLVSRDVPAGALVAGSPASVVREVAKREPSWAQRIALLEEVTAEVARERSEDIGVTMGDGYRSVSVGSQEVLRIHERVGPPEWSLEALNILPSPPEPMERGSVQWWELSGSTSSPVREMTDLTREWFKHARGIGVRFYATDETPGSSEGG